MSTLGVSARPRTDRVIHVLVDGDPAIRWQVLRDLAGGDVADCRGSVTPSFCMHDQVPITLQDAADAQLCTSCIQLAGK